MVFDIHTNSIRQLSYYHLLCAASNIIFTSMTRQADTDYCTRCKYCCSAAPHTSYQLIWNQPIISHSGTFTSKAALFLALFLSRSVHRSSLLLETRLWPESSPSKMVSPRGVSPRCWDTWCLTKDNFSWSSTTEGWKILLMCFCCRCGREADLARTCPGRDSEQRSSETAAEGQEVEQRGL